MRKHLKPATPAWIIGQSSSCKETSVVCVYFGFDSIQSSCKCAHFLLSCSSEQHLIAKNHASPEDCVHKTLSRHLLLLLTKITKCGGWRDAISVESLTKKRTEKTRLLTSILIFQKISLPLPKASLVS